MPTFVAFHAGLQCCQSTHLEVSTTQKVKADGIVVDKFKIIVGNSKPNVSDQFKKVFKRYTMDTMRHSACLVVNQISVYNYVFFFNCTTVDYASDSLTALT